MQLPEPDDERQQSASTMADLELSRILQAIDAAVDESRDLTALSDDWDGEGSQGYSQEVWRRATDFVRESAIRLWADSAKRLIPPVFLPGPQGGIDIEWAVGSLDLIIRVPFDRDGKAEFYGRRSDCLTIKGKVDLTCPDSRWLLTWIVK